MSDYSDNPNCDEEPARGLRRVASDIANYAHHDAPLTCIHPLGEDRLVTSGWDGTFRIWTRTTGELLHQHDLDYARVDVLAADPTQGLAVFGVQRSLEVIDLNSGEPLTSFDRDKTAELAPSPVHAAEFHPDGDVLLTGSQDKCLRLWDLDSGALIDEFRGHRRAISAIDIPDGGPLVISAALDGEVRTWDLRKAENRTNRWLGQYPITALEAVDAHALFALGTSHGELIVWNAERDEIEQRWPAHDGTIHDITALDASHFASVAADGELRIWHIDTRELTAWYDGGVQLHACVYDASVLLVGTNDGTLLELQWPPGDL